MAFLNGFQFYFMVLSFVFITAHAVVYNSNDQESFHGGKYKLYWAFNATEDKVYFKLEVETLGYVALGFSDKGFGMKNLDCVISGVDTNRGYIMDLKASDISTPDLDKQQNYQLESSSETNSKTTVEFSRKRDTGDSSQDMKFVPGQAVHVAWAYGTSDTPSHNDLQYHDNRGYSLNKLVFVPLLTTTVATSAKLSPTKAFPAIATSKPSPVESLSIIAVSTAQSKKVTLSLSSAMTSTSTNSVVTTTKSPGVKSIGSRICCQCLFLLAFVLVATLF